MRLQTVEQYAQNWLRNDRDKAVKWLQQSDLPPETLVRLLRPETSNQAQPGPRPTPSPQMDLEMMRRYGLIPMQ
jgi:hypothetical protein